MQNWLNLIDFYTITTLLQIFSPIIVISVAQASLSLRFLGC